MYRSVMRKRSASFASYRASPRLGRSPKRRQCSAVRRPLLGRKFTRWLAAAIVGLLFVPAVASAAFILQGKTGQGLGVALRVSSNLSKVVRFAVGWRATCTSGGSYGPTVSLDARAMAVKPFPHFQSSGTYTTSTVNVANGQTVRLVVSVELHGQLMRNGRASGRWAAQARVLDASGNQIDFCHTGVVRWTAHLI
jgi:hypothetical protein